MSEVTKYRHKKTNRGVSAQIFGLLLSGIILFSFMRQRYEKKIIILGTDYRD